jgi:phytoene dehydrogenase-like protein
MLKDLKIEWEFLQNVISIGIEDQLFPVRSMADLQQYQQVLTRLYPENEAEIDWIMNIILQLSEYTSVLYEFDNPNFVNLRGNPKFIFRKLIPWTFKFLGALRKFEQYKMPMEDFLNAHISNPSLVDILIQHFFRKTPTYFALGYFYVYLDYFYPRGGTGTLSRLVQEKVIENGGEIRLKKNIVEIIPAESKVIDSTGCEYYYDDLIWAADLKTMYRILNPVKLEQSTVAKIEAEALRKQSGKGAESTFILYLAVNRPPEFFRQNGGAHLFYTPSRQGLGRVNQEDRQRLLEDFEQRSKEDVFNWLDQYLRLNTFEISIPVLRDETLAPAGQTGVMVSCLFDYQILKKIERAGWYDEFKQAFETRLVEILSQSIYKGFAEDILFRSSATPLTIQRLCGSSEGAITGWSFETPPPVVNTLKDIPKSVLTPLAHLYQAGQWAYSPAGVPIAMLTGWYATQKIIKQARKSR